MQAQQIILLFACFISGAYTTCSGYNTTVISCGIGDCFQDKCYCATGWANQQSGSLVLSYCTLSIKQSLGVWFIVVWTIPSVVYAAFIPLIGYIVYKFYMHKKRGGNRDSTGLTTFLVVLCFVMARTIGTVGEAIYLGNSTSRFYNNALIDFGFGLEFCSVALILKFWVKLLSVFFGSNSSTFLVAESSKRSTIFIVVTIGLIAVWHIVIVVFFALNDSNYYMTIQITTAYKYTFGAAAILLGFFFVCVGGIVIYKLAKLRKQMSSSHRLLKLSNITNLLVSLGALILGAVVFDFLIATSFAGANSSTQYAMNRFVIFLLDTYLVIVLVLVMGRKKLPVTSFTKINSSFSGTSSFA